MGDRGHRDADRDDARGGWGTGHHLAARHPGRYVADPFGVERDGVLHVLFEEFDQRRARGYISHLAIDPGGGVSEATPVLDPGSHASYPFLVEHEGGVFMLPEVAQAGELVFYQAVDFPYSWRPAVTLLPGVPAVDASVVEFDGLWWMFATRLDRGPNQNLFAWHAPTLTGPWTAHAANPVKTDARSARPGGTPFVWGGRLYRRPGQLTDVRRSSRPEPGGGPDQDGVRGAPRPGPRPAEGFAVPRRTPYAVGRRGPDARGRQGPAFREGCRAIQRGEQLPVRRSS